MTEIVRNSITLRASPESVFAFITDPATAPLRTPTQVHDQYRAHSALAAGDQRETTCAWLGIRWQERRWVAKVEPESMKVIWHTDSRYVLREEWRVEGLDAGRCRLVLERQLSPRTLPESILWRLVTAHLTNRTLNRRLSLTRAAVEGGWRPGPSLLTA